MNLDKNQVFWNQITNHDPDECCGITVADIVGNIIGIVCDPDFSYAASFQVNGKTPSNSGTNPISTAQGAILYGVLPASNETFTAATAGETYVANLNNYTSAQFTDALKYVQNGIVYLTTFDDYVNFLYDYKTGAGVQMDWYQSFLETGADGLLPAPNGQITQHEVAVYDYDLVTDQLIFKPWLGKTFGQNGCARLSRSQFSALTKGGFGFNPKAIRWISVISILAIQFPALLNYIAPILKSLLKQS